MKKIKILEISKYILNFNRYKIIVIRFNLGFNSFKTRVNLEQLFIQNNIILVFFIL
jgi:hypothetical protein